DFAALGLDFTARFRRLNESLSIMRRLWAGESVDGASLGPVWPAALGGPPVLIGSWAGSRWIERAAREFDGWIGSGARSSWRALRELGFDDVVLVPRHHDAEHLQELRALAD